MIAFVSSFTLWTYLWVFSIFSRYYVSFFIVFNAFDCPFFIFTNPSFSSYKIFNFCFMCVKWFSFSCIIWLLNTLSNSLFTTNILFFIYIIYSSCFFSPSFFYFIFSSSSSNPTPYFFCRVILSLRRISSSWEASS